MIENEALQAFKNAAIVNYQNPVFVYHEFFVEDHLLIVEKNAMELCDLYPEADREAVFALVWFHDFGKAIDFDNETAMTISEGVKAMKDACLHQDLIEKVIGFWQRMEMKNEIDISQEPIEVQIISSADGAAHLVGKFFATYFRDDPTEPIKKIEERIRKKIEKDWEKKITLPEVKAAFRDSYMRALEITGQFPDKYI